MRKRPSPKLQLLSAAGNRTGATAPSTAVDGLHRFLADWPPAPAVKLRLIREHEQRDVYILPAEAAAAS